MKRWRIAFIFRWNGGGIPSVRGDYLKKRYRSRRRAEQMASDISRLLPTDINNNRLTIEVRREI